MIKKWHTHTKTTTYITTVKRHPFQVINVSLCMQPRWFLTMKSLQEIRLSKTKYISCQYCALNSTFCCYTLCFLTVLLCCYNSLYYWGSGCVYNKLLQAYNHTRSTQVHVNSALKCTSTVLVRSEWFNLIEPLHTFLNHFTREKNEVYTLSHEFRVVRRGYRTLSNYIHSLITYTQGDLG